MTEKFIFQESQKSLSQKIYLWPMLFGFGLFVGFYVKADFQADSDRIGYILTILFYVLICVVLLATKLETSITSSKITVQFKPFQRKPISYALEDIATWKVRKYRPIAEYGGWGIRFGLKGKRAYSIAGRYGIDLKLKNGKIVLIGTQIPEEAERAMTKLFG
jgi:hypothetical protein